MLEPHHHIWPDISLGTETAESLFWLGEHIPGGFFVYRENETQDLLYANGTTLRIFGCDTMEEFKELTGGNFRGMVHPKDYEQIQASIEQQIIEDDTHKFDYVEYRIVRKDGQIRWVEDYGHLVTIPKYGDVYYVFISDATERKKAEREKIRTELAFAREMHAQEARSSFLFNLSHDIRTPMNAIVGFSELARRHADDSQLLGTYLDKTVWASRQLLSLINDMLEMNLIGMGALELIREPCLLRQQLDGAVDLVSIQAAEKGVQLVRNYNLDDIEVLVDTACFCRIVGNLLDNAVKFTPAGGTVEVLAHQEPGEHPNTVNCTITVSDTGIGMSSEFMERMYGPFVRRGTSTATRTTGTGLGLTIAKSLIELVGGRIEAQSTEGKGTTFTIYFTLPMVVEQKADAKLADSAPLALDGRPPRILVVEDVDLNRMLAAALLEDEGFLAETATDGYEAVETVKHHPEWYFDLILMDIQMPVMNGYEATRAIRALPREDCMLIPIVALSANGQEEDISNSLASGMNDHMIKPFDTDELVATIMSYVSRYRKQSHGTR